MASNGAIPPSIPEVPEDQKFDGGVKISWNPVKRKITNALRAQGLTGYINGTVKKPSVDTQVTSPTPVYSSTPSLEEWDFRNERAKGVIEAYVDDITSLVPNADSLTASELMNTFDAEYAATDEMKKVLTERKLRSYTFKGEESIDNFFKTLRCDISDSHPTHHRRVLKN
ncbi:hypothetical protein GGU11DRAFT_757545 [Lentinula aff. detonsa]|nr:hypothetical protein GGU11DRAFT_757545 [Lentinula aff. detonsa]